MKNVILDLIKLKSKTIVFVADLSKVESNTLFKIPGQENAGDFYVFRKIKKFEDAFMIHLEISPWSHCMPLSLRSKAIQLITDEEAAAAEFEREELILQHKSLVVQKDFLFNVNKDKESFTMPINYDNYTDEELFNEVHELSIMVGAIEWDCY